MKTVRFFAVSLFIIGTFAAAAFAQASTPMKVAIIDTNGFYDPDKGIKKLSDEFKKLDVEFKPIRDELQQMADKITRLQTEVKAMQENKSVPVNEATLRAKVAEGERLSRELKFKQDEANANYQSRQQALVAPVTQDIAEKIAAFAKSKGIDLVLDLDKLLRDASILYRNDTIDITAAFITYYNGLPAGTANK